MKITKACLKKALRTFIQAVIAYVAVNIALIDFSDGKAALTTALTGLATSAVAAGLSAVMNLEKKADDTSEDG